MSVQPSDSRYRTAIQAIEDVATGYDRIPVSAARAVAEELPTLNQEFGKSVSEVLGSRFAVIEEALLIGIRSDRLTAQCERVLLQPEKYPVSQIEHLLRGIREHGERDPEFREIMNARRASSQLEELVQASASNRSLPFAQLTEGKVACTVSGSPTAGISEVIRQIEKNLGPGIQVGIRGGSHAEGVGWLTNAAQDPRVGGELSTFTRRTGGAVPLFEIMSTTYRAEPRELDQMIRDAHTYALSGHLAEQMSHRYARESKDPPTRDQVLAGLTDEIYKSPTGPSFGVLMVFAAEDGTFKPSFHRRDSTWNEGSYRHCVTMDTMNRRDLRDLRELGGLGNEGAPASGIGEGSPGAPKLVALLPIPKTRLNDHKDFAPHLEGAFAMLVTPELMRLPSGVLKELFKAAFVEMDRAKFDAIYEAEIRKFREAA